MEEDEEEVDVPKVCTLLGRANFTRFTIPLGRTRSSDNSRQSFLRPHS